MRTLATLLLTISIAAAGFTGVQLAESAAGEIFTRAPSIRNTNAYAIETSEVVLLGAIDPHGLRTVWRFEVGKTRKYGLRLAGVSEEHPLTGETFEGVEEGVAGLAAGTVYHFRVVARNAAGRTVGPDRTFRTKRPR